MADEEKISFLVDAKDMFSSTFDKLGGYMPTITKAVAGATIAIGAAGAAILALVDSTSEWLDSLAKTSAKLDTSTEWLSQYQYMAERSGISTESFNKGIEKMIINIDEATKGTGPAAEALAALGLNAEALAKLDTAEQFAAIREAFSNFDSEAANAAAAIITVEKAMKDNNLTAAEWNNLAPDERMKLLKAETGGVSEKMDELTVAYKLFGKSGTDLVNLLELNDEQFNALISDSERFGAIIGGDAAKAAEDYNDSMLNVHTALKQVSSVVVEELGPQITELANTFAAFIVENGPAIADWVNKSAEAFGVLIDFVAQLATAIIDLGTWIGETFADAYTWIEWFLNTSTKGIGDFINEADDWATALVDGFIQGIKSEAAAAYAAVADFVEGIRAYLPFSPAEVGPLSDLDKVGPGFVNTIASGISTSAPTVDAAVSDMAYGMAAGISGGGASTSPAGGLTINATFTIEGGSDVDVAELAKKFDREMSTMWLNNRSQLRQAAEATA